MHIVVLILVYLPEEKRAFICTFGLPCFLRPPYHLGPAKLNPYEQQPKRGLLATSL